ncbi:MAG TPA: hypothetical protein GXZ32_02645 [Clostridiales bacterium]|nr:hypothetical protein [Clostridiales bacterium]
MEEKMKIHRVMKMLDKNIPDAEIARSLDISMDELRAYKAKAAYQEWKERQRKIKNRLKLF